MISVDGGSTATYTYDAFGNRVESNLGGTLYDFIYGADGRKIDEYEISSGYTGGLMSFAYLGGQQIAEYRNGTTYFIFADHVGSARVMTGVSGSVTDSYDYMPFGEQFSTGTNTVTARYAGMDYDTETSIHHTLFRQYPAFQGRWLSPDPGSMGASSREVSYFVTGGVQVGWNGGVQASTSTGLIFGRLNADSSGFSGTFYNASGSGALLGGAASVGNGVIVASPTVGANLTATPTFEIGSSTTSKPYSGGNIATNPVASLFHVVNFGLHAVVCQQ